MLAHGAESEGNEFEVRLIPRFEVNPYIPFHGGKGDCDFGMTGLYSLIEGNFGDHVSYSFTNQWLSTDPASLYSVDEDGKSANLFRSDYGNWLQMGYFTFSLGNWELSLGKDAIMIGTFEEDSYDFDSHANLNTYFWNAAQIYQWGAKLGWTTPSESSQFVLQVSASPFSTRPFGKSWRGNEDGHLKTFTAGWYGDYDCFSSVWSVNMMEYEKNKYIGMLGLGNQFYLGDFTISLDWLTRATSFSNFFGQETSLTAGLQYNLADKAEFFVKGGYENANDEDFFAYEDDCFVPSCLSGDYWFGGLGLHYYPLKNSKDLRVHCIFAANNSGSESSYKNAMSVNFGVTYNFSLTSLLKKK